jgi:hypothetical protein
MRKFAACAAVSVCAGLALGVTPGEWTHATEADFADGEFASTVVNSLGEISLSRQVTILAPSSAAPAVVSAVAPAGKMIYFASGSGSAIYRIREGKTEQFAKTPGAMVCSLLWTGRELLAGVGGQEAGIYTLDRRGGAKCRWSDPNVKYVWAMVPGERGTVYAATGAEGAVYAVDKEGKAQAVYRTGQLAKNVLCLARSKSGLIYAGTDENGLVIEIDPAAKTGRVILDAEEKEIAAVAPDESGGVYAATSDAAKAAEEGAVEPAAAKGGKPQPATAPRKEPPNTGPASRPGLSPRGFQAAIERALKTSTTGKAGADTPSMRSDPAELAAATKPRPAPAPAARPPRAPPAAAPEEEAGNAVYYVRPDGLVTTVLRKPLTILAMKLHEGKLILATGNGGCIYSTSPDGQDVTRIADTDAKQVTCLAVAADGRIVFGAANKGSVGALEKELAKEGTFTSKALDAKQIAKWGTVRVESFAGPGAAVAVATRSGNLAEPNDNTWSRWSNDQPVGESFVPVSSPAGRFLQYRLKLTAQNSPPVVQAVGIVYQVGNLPPVISSLTLKASGASREGEQESPDRPQAFRHLAITASDANGDKLTYSLFFRQVGTESWIKIADKLEAPNYVWDTQSVGDGTYQLRAVASDSPANPPESAAEASRISSPFEVDNTTPAISLAAKIEKGAVALSGQAVDAGSRIVSIHYAVDSNTDWTAVLPADGIADSPRERFEFRLDDLQEGSHRIAVKAADLFGNTGYATVTVTIGK